MIETNATVFAGRDGLWYVLEYLLGGVWIVSAVGKRIYGGI